MTDGTGRQPLLHDLLITLAAPTVLLSTRSGDLDSGGPDAGAQGLFHADLRVLSRLRLTLDGLSPASLLEVHEPGRSRFVSWPRNLGGSGPDPVVRLERTRRLDAGRLSELIELSSMAPEPLQTVVRLELGTDLQNLDQAKAGRLASEISPRLIDGALLWRRGPVEVQVRAHDGDVEESGALSWRVHLKPGATVALRWSVSITESAPLLVAAPAAATWSRPVVVADDPRLEQLLEQSLDDLNALRLALPSAPDDVFLAAGAPWFFTLFGRDSLWAARMLLPLGTDLARGTLRCLAVRQGVRDDLASQEQPGRILHELRRGTFDGGTGIVLPPTYYGTIDATLLWVCLLHDAWRWGMADADVIDLLPHLETALAWMGATAELGHGFLSYEDRGGAGLANQGWKDSGDAVRFRDGRVARSPVALVEVQGYAYEAAIAGAALLDAFGRPGVARWRTWAAELAQRFRSSFWIEDERGRCPAMALDGSGARVDSVTSNIGHLLGGGLLDERETALVAARVTAPDMADGYGLRTMSSRAGGYSPMSYHCGTVWPHDTAIVAAGLARSGHGAQAGALIDGLLAASVGFGGRLPELWSGDARAHLPRPVPYPAACRPQAWAAASSVSLLSTILGLTPDAATAALTLRPMSPSPVGTLSVRGLMVSGRRVDVHLDAAGIRADSAGPPVTDHRKAR